VTVCSMSSPFTEVPVIVNVGEPAAMMSMPW